MEKEIIKVDDICKEEQKDLGLIIDTQEKVHEDNKESDFNYDRETKEGTIQRSEEFREKEAVEIEIKDEVIEKDDHLNFLKETETNYNEVSVEKGIEDEEIKSL